MCMCVCVYVCVCVCGGGGGVYVCIYVCVSVCAVIGLGLILLRVKSQVMNTTAESIALRSKDFYSTHGIDVKLGKEVRAC